AYPRSVRVRLRVQNFVSLRTIDFEIPVGVSVLVGPNGSGKSTLLDTIELIRHAVDSGLLTAIGHHFGSAAALRNYDAPPDAPISLGLDVDEVSWDMQLRVDGAGISPASPEMLSVAGRVKLRGEALPIEAGYDGQAFEI